MTDVTVSDLKAKIASFQFNPAGIQRVVLDALQRATDNEEVIVDPTNPFVFCLESSAVMTAAFMAKNATDTRRQYPYSAQTPEDLYVHMSDRDYAGRFATPSGTKFGILLPMEEVLNKLVTDPDTGIKKIVIPRNSFFTVADTNFSIQYPIEIRQLAHGGIQVMYDVENPSPLQELSTNVLEWQLLTRSGVDFIFFEFDVMQFNIISRSGNLSSALDFKLDIGFTDQYYYTRVYVETAQGTWQEIKTTHTDQIYDQSTPTAVLKVVEQNVEVRIPQIYTSTGLLSRGIRIDVYETKGRLDMIMSNYPLAAYTATWETLDPSDATIFTAPLKTFRQIMPFSNRTVSGGSNALPFDTLRERVIRNAIGTPTPPITNVQLENALENDGYEVVKNVDNITNRVFLATKPMPDPVDQKLITAAAASIEMVSLSVAEAVQIDSVIDNGASITITPDTLYRIRSGVVKMVSTQQKNQLLALPPDQRAGQVTSGNYLYTPFHYVLDMSGDEFQSRPYYLDSPTVETKLFVAENDTTLLQVATKIYGVTRTPTGYNLQIVLESGDAWKALADSEVFVQLAFVPNGEKDMAYMLGTLAGLTDEGERIYNFDLSTTFNIDADDGMELTKFFMYSQEPHISKAPLFTDFSVIFSTSVVMGPQWRTSAVDDVLGRFLLPARIAGVTHEKLRVRFGYALSTLWSRSRSVISSVPYQKWDVNVPRLYEKDVYRRDPVTGWTVKIENGVPVYDIEHHAGDPVLDSEGNPTYQWKIGDTKLDGNGNPIPLNLRGMVRQLDVMFLEGAYWFATDITTKSYRTSTVQQVVSWLTNDLPRMSAQVLEQTRLYFYPKTTLGNVSAMIEEGVTTTINAGQAFLVKLYVSAAVAKNDKLRQTLQSQTVLIISAYLREKTTVSMSAILKALRDQYGQDVIDVEVSGLGGDANLPVLTLLNDGDRCSIRKRLVAQADDTLIVQEDVTFDFVRHELVTE
jgi:hypothetical protein